MAKKVYVGMSGGVDSSVTAALLKEQGYDVTGVYMKNWTEDLPGMVCPWKEDYQDAKRVAVQLGIPFKLYDFQKEYSHKVVDYMIEEYKTGRTPNPDIMCNQEIKFKLFLEAALEDGADLIATGHYARIVSRGAHSKGFRPEPPQRPLTRGRALTEPNETTKLSLYGQSSLEYSHADLHAPAPLRLSLRDGSGLAPAEPRVELHTGLDSNKDQSYFLCRVSEAALRKSLMPIGEYTKPEVRKLARKFGLATAEKKDSQGICFVGKVGIKDFLQQFVESTPGKIIDQNGQVVGEHEGALFYTIGQRQGLGVGGGLPYYVVGKDMTKNEVYVTSDLQDTRLWSRELTLASPHWINEPPQPGVGYTVRTRYRAEPLTISSLRQLENGNWQVTLHDEVRALTPGQSAVMYENSRVVGGGVVL